MTGPATADVRPITGAVPPDQRKALAVQARTPLINMGLQEMANMAKLLARSGLLGKAVQTPEAAFAIIVAGQELGLTPMLALRCINLVDGKVTVDAGAQFGAFKSAGGKATFTQLDAEGAVLALRHPNGDEHVESFTIQEARSAGLLNKDNWKRYPKAMLRSRVITAGLKSVGFQPTMGMYDPEELEPLPPYKADPTMVAASIENHNAQEEMAAVQEASDVHQPSGVLYPYGPHRKAGHRVDQRDADGNYIISDVRLSEASDWLQNKLLQVESGSDDYAKLNQWLEGVRDEQEARRGAYEDAEIGTDAGEGPE